MAHVNVYLDDELLEKTRAVADMKGCSLSQYVREKIAISVRKENEWPEGYFEDVCGSLSDTNIERPDQPVLQDDAGRRSL
jgi:hypothetical protein